jgi:hypothetical protein
MLHNDVFIDNAIQPHGYRGLGWLLARLSSPLEPHHRERSMI